MSVHHQALLGVQRYYVNPSIDWKVALKYAQLVKIAESVKPEGGYGAQQVLSLNNLDYKFVSTIFGSDLASDAKPDGGDVVTFGFVALSTEGEMVAAIRGTDTWREWAQDADFLMVPAPSGIPGATDDGFSAVYKSLRVADEKSGPTPVAFIDDFPTAKSVTVCGHSLGGALATLLSCDIAKNTVFSCANSPTSYTFASPRVGDHAFADSYNKAVPKTFRIANRMDAVSMLPTVFPIPYEHVAQHVEILTKPPLYGSIPCLHHLDSYLWLISRLAGVGGFELDANCIEK